MKNNKAFTLVELLAVVVILLVLVVIITPKVINHISKSGEVAYNKQIEELIGAAKVYMNQNSNLLPDDVYVISLQDLKNSGLISNSRVLNPDTNEELDGCVVVNYNGNYSRYDYVYYDGSELVCDQE